MTFKRVVFLLLFIYFCGYVAETRAQTLEPTLDIRYIGVVRRDANGDTLRSSRVVTAFRKLWACPSTKSKVGACPGWSIDHVAAGWMRSTTCSGSRIKSNLQRVRTPKITLSAKFMAVTQCRKDAHELD
jgi:hypothetical protein